MDQVVDFWADPSYAQLLLAEQKRIHDFVVADKGTAKEALDGLVADWKKVFKEDGKVEVDDKAGSALAGRPFPCR